MSGVGKLRRITLHQYKGVPLRPALLEVHQVEDDNVLSGFITYLNQRINGSDELRTRIAIDQVISFTKPIQCSRNEIGLPEPVSGSTSMPEYLSILPAEESADILWSKRDHAVTLANLQRRARVTLLS
jgi:hypothetical protein